jgi:hypothetical protein
MHDERGVEGAVVEEMGGREGGRSCVSAKQREGRGVVQVLVLAGCN